MAGRGEQTSSSKNFEFVSSNLAPQARLERATNSLHLPQNYFWEWTISLP